MGRRAIHRVGSGVVFLALACVTQPHVYAQPAPPVPDYVPGEILVKFKPGISAAKTASFVSTLGLQPVRHFASIDVHSYRLPDGTGITAAVQLCQSDPAVEYAEPNYIYTASRLPNDPRFAESWALENAADTDVDAPEAWDLQTGSASVLVAVIDTGVDYAHEDLQANMWRNPGESGRGREHNGVDDDRNGFVDDVFGWDFASQDNDPQDDNGHGSHVAGTIAATGDNQVGVTGVAWQTSIMALKFLSASGSGSAADAIEAILYASNNGARVMNNSWGGGGLSQALRDAIVFARDHNVVFVAAAGNEGRDNDGSPSYPASYEVENVLSVAAHDRAGALASFSNFGKTSVDVSAPGVDILNVAPGNSYRSLSGTSMATPHVSGIAALVLAQFPQQTYRQVLVRIFGSVDRQAAFETTTWSGGRVNAFQALSRSPRVAFVTRLEDTVDAAGPYRVEADVADDGTVAAVVLQYSVAGTPQSLPMPNVSDMRYEAEIPGQALGTLVTYFVEATDDTGNTTQGPSYAFRIGTPSTTPGCGEVDFALVSTPQGKALVAIGNLGLLVGVVLGARKLRSARHTHAPLRR